MPVANSFEMFSGTSLQARSIECMLSFHVFFLHLFGFAKAHEVLDIEDALESERGLKPRGEK